MYIKNGKHAIFIKTLKIILDLFLFFFVLFIRLLYEEVMLTVFLGEIHWN